MSRTVVFIHDAWLGPGIWRAFADRFAACGYTSLAPAWPGLAHADRVQVQVQLQEQAQEQAEASPPHKPPAGLAALDMHGLLAHHAHLIRSLGGAPLLIGHGVGGLLVQQLLDQGLGAAGIAIAPVPPLGVWPGWALLRRLAPCWSGKSTSSDSSSRQTSRRASPSSRARQFMLSEPPAGRVMTREHFDRNLAHSLPDAQRAQAFKDWVVPTSARLLWQTSLGIGCAVDFGNDRREALLFIAAEGDRWVQASSVAATCQLHRRSVATTAMLRYPGRSHLLITEPGWEDIADACIDWANEQLGGF